MPTDISSAGYGTPGRSQKFIAECGLWFDLHCVVWHIVRFGVHLGTPPSPHLSH